MKLHFVGGFLGSGKTTAIIGACKQLLRNGQRVGVITNDQGRFLVDTAFFRKENVPTLEVSGGCFCMHIDDLEERIEEISRIQQLDVVFAEAVGSSADLVETVIRPLSSQLDEMPSYSVFSDCRLLRMYLMGLPLPFSEDVLYLFRKQIEGAAFLVVNKMDLLTKEEAQSLKELVRSRFTEKEILFQNSLDEGSLTGWLCALENGEAALSPTILNLDHFRFALGEAHLAWMDERIDFEYAEGQARALLIDFFEHLLSSIHREKIGVGHLKCFLITNALEMKLSFTALPDEHWQDALPEIPGTKMQLILNARLEVPAADIRSLVSAALQYCGVRHAIRYREAANTAFHPQISLNDLRRR